MKQPIVKILLVALLAATAHSAENAEKRVTILFTNDVHAHIDNDPGIRYSHVAQLKRDCARKGPVFLVDAGDYLQGAAYALFDGGRRIVELMNAAGYDVATVGNHEFDFHATNLLARAAQANFPIVSCNVWRREKKEHRPRRAFAPSAVLTNQGVSVAFVGLTAPETIDAEGARCFYDPTGSWQAWGCWGHLAAAADELYARVQAAVDEARAWKPDYVVLLGHVGETDDLRPYRSADIIAYTSGIDCFIDGHSHTRNAGTVVTNAAGRGVVLAQTGSHLAAVGRMELEKGHEPVSRLVTNLVARQEAVARLEQTLIDDMQGRLSEPIASLAFDMPAKSAADGSWLVRTHATAIGDLTADAFYWYANAKGGFSNTVDVALIQGAGIRDGLMSGEITLKDVVAITSFQNELIVTEMPGQTILDALEWGARNAPLTSNGDLLHVAGLRYAVSTNHPSAVRAVNNAWHGLAPNAPRRVARAEVYDRSEGRWKRLDPKRSYRVVANDYLLGGGAGFSMLAHAAPAGCHGNAKRDWRQFADYLKSFPGGSVSSEKSPLNERGYAAALAYERPQGGERILLISAPPQARED